jgi:hypothetical protein
LTEYGNCSPGERPVVAAWASLRKPVGFDPTTAESQDGQVSRVSRQFLSVEAW